jgi:hypothetical protein
MSRSSDIEEVGMTTLFSSLSVFLIASHLNIDIGARGAKVCSPGNQHKRVR